MTKKFDVIEAGWSALRTQMIQAATEKTARALANDLDDILAGLLINGVSPAAICVHSYPDRTVVSVSGVNRYEIKYSFTVDAQKVSDAASRS